jgi:hypothetical protein
MDRRYFEGRQYREEGEGRRREGKKEEGKKERRKKERRDKTYLWRLRDIVYNNSSIRISKVNRS